MGRGVDDTHVMTTHSSTGARLKNEVVTHVCNDHTLVYFGSAARGIEFILFFRFSFDSNNFQII